MFNFDFVKLPPEIQLYLLSENLSISELLRTRTVSKSLAHLFNSPEFFRLRCKKEFNLILLDQDIEKLKDIYKALFYLRKTTQRLRPDLKHYYALHAGRLLEKFGNESWAKCGLAYLIGNGYGGFIKDLNKALTLEEKDVTDNLPSQYYFSMLIKQFRSVRTDKSFLEKILEKINKLKNYPCVTSPAARAMGTYYLNRKNPEESLTWYQKAYQLNVISGANSIGYFYNQQSDLQEAIRWYEKSKNFSEIFLLSWQLNSKLAKTSFENYYKHQQQLFAAGNIEAAYNLYESIIDPEFKYDAKHKAIDWLIKASDSNHPQALLQWSFHCYRGKLVKEDQAELVKKDQEKAKQLFTKGLGLLLSETLRDIILPDISSQVMQDFYDNFYDKKLEHLRNISPQENLKFWFINYLAGVRGINPNSWKAFQIAEEIFKFNTTKHIAGTLVVLSLMDSNVKQFSHPSDSIKWLQIACQCGENTSIQWLEPLVSRLNDQDIDKINQILNQFANAPNNPLVELQNFSTQDPETSAAANMALCFIYLTGVGTRGSKIAVNHAQVKTHLLNALKANWQHAFYYIVKMKQERFLQFETFIELNQIFSEQKYTLEEVKELQDLKQWINENNFQSLDLIDLLTKFCAPRTEDSEESLIIAANGT